MGYNPSWITQDPIFHDEDISEAGATFSHVKQSIDELLHSYGSQDEILRALPIAAHDGLDIGKQTFTYKILLAGRYTQGAGRFIADMLSTYLVPGKYSCILSNTSTRVFVCGKPAFFTQYHIEVVTPQDFPIIAANVKSVSRLLQTTILGVIYLRRFLSKKVLTADEEHMIVQQNFKDLSHESFGPFHNKFVSKLSRSISQTSLFPVLGTLKKERETMFRRDVFYGIQRFYYSLPVEMKGKLSHRSHGRMLAQLYYFKKMLEFKKEGFYLRVLPYSQAKGRCISLLILLSSVDQTHDLLRLMKGCLKLVPQMRKIDDFSIDDVDSGVLISSLGILFEKEDGSPFSTKEFHLLKSTLHTALNANPYAKPLSSLDTLLSLSKKVRLATSQKYGALIDQLTPPILASDKENRALLKSYVSSFTALPEFTAESTRALLTGYYMLHVLSEKSDHIDTIETSAQRVDGYFIFTLATKHERAQSAASTFLRSYKMPVFTSSFTIGEHVYVALLFPYDSLEALKETRVAITGFIRSMQLDLESEVHYS